MSRVRITVVRKEEVVVDIGDLPPRLIEENLRKHEGALSEKYGLYDLKGTTDSVESITVVEVGSE